ISGAQCASAQQCNGAGTCTATANVALCTNPNNCASVSCNANNYQCEYSGCACQTSSSAWTNNGFTSQTGTFTVEFDATPNNAAMDGVIGLSNGAQTAYSSFSALVRFKSTGNIDVYDSTGYRYDVLVPYTASTAYHIKMIVNVPAQTYDVFVRAGSGSEQQIANDYRFRSTALASSLNNWGFISSTGTLDVCNFVVNVQEAVCGDGICSVGEICPQDAVGCADNICYEPTCTNGCGQVAVASGGTDESCVAPNSCNGAGVCVSPPAVCGNGIVETGEQCDDGNTITESCAYGQTSCTVCNNICQLVSGATAYCGDSIINGAEQCDDGNTISGDGCSSICQNELSCSLTSASWSQTSVVEGTQVNLNVQGNNCAGQNFNYTIYEDDILVDDVVTSFVSTSLNPTWTSVYVNDGIGDPEYYFITRVVSNPAENIQSIGLLTVTRAPTTQCNDGIDNDGDGAVDYPNDFGCVDINDNSEINNGATQCSDGIDNDGDGRIDQADCALIMLI
ncbi:hypothetical protein HYV50_00510, partial [Candidatus Pacearchaeota archaeon]|nr:hypothetical protein [Candidatus Pacearchaeota archaeon]